MKKKDSLKNVPVHEKVMIFSLIGLAILLALGGLFLFFFLAVKGLFFLFGVRCDNGDVLWFVLWFLFFDTIFDLLKYGGKFAMGYLPLEKTQMAVLLFLFYFQWNGLAVYLADSFMDNIQLSFAVQTVLALLATLAEVAFDDIFSKKISGGNE